MATKKTEKVTEKSKSAAEGSKKTAAKKAAEPDLVISEPKATKKPVDKTIPAETAKKAPEAKTEAPKKVAKPESATKAKTPKSVETKPAETVKPVKKAEPAKVAETKPAQITEKEKLTKSAPKTEKSKTAKSGKTEQKVIEAAPEAQAVAEKAQESIDGIKKPFVRYSDEDLDFFHRRISDVRKEALEELTMLKERLEDLTNYDFAEESMIYSMHMAEQGSEAMEKEKTYAQIQRINEYIKKLDEALQRISEKTYGICRVCGCLIAKERLLAVPITTLSASYKIHKKCPEDGIDRIEPVR